MSEQLHSAQAASPVFTDGFRTHLGKMNGNGVAGAVQPGRSPDQPSKIGDFSEHEVREELESILNSPEFKNKPMLCSFVRHVVEETLAGRDHEIKGYTIATQVFNRRKDFDPTIDPIVRIQAGRLRRSLESYYAGSGSQDQLRIEIGKGSYVPTVSRHIPENLGKGLTRQRPWAPYPEVEILQDSAKIALPSGGAMPSIAIMPLINLTNDPDEECLGHGLIEELMNELACWGGFQVKASHSTTDLMGKNTDAGETEQALGLRFFMEGSFRKEGRTVKFTLRLIDAATLVQIWGEQYKRDLEPDNIIHLQEEIARSVAASIGGIFGAVPRKPSKESLTKAPGDIEIYDALLRLSQYLIELSHQAHAGALDALELIKAKTPESGVALPILACLRANE